ncbi:hypothetical protein KUL156_41720 [Alteromonas sp. KUL156]|nr:hypothetical protein KUL154_09440 [Alteromonas sp. KUL154]GFE01580.1 hypothetical protein KUL156_41720 [Alteromonas sp. KUL156]
MNEEKKDKIISKLSVRLKDSTDNVIGTGVLYYHPNLRDKVYVFTATHCLYKDSDEFEDKRDSLKIDFYNSSNRIYESIQINNIDEELISKNKDNDLAIIVLDKITIERIVGNIPLIRIATERQNNSDFTIKGFPKATKGKELDVIFPKWKQRMTEVNKFQLEITEDYTEWNIEGFSGSGVFLTTKDSIYLYGIFTRYRSEEKGRVIYCQFIPYLNSLLEKKYLPKIKFSYLGNNGITPVFFEHQVTNSIINLGPRFDERLNFQLPIAKLFNDLTFDDNFKTRFFKVLDSWLLESIYDEFSNNSDLKYIDDAFFSFKEKVKKWYTENELRVDIPIETDWIADEVYQLDEKIETELNLLRELQYQELKNRKDKGKDEPYKYLPDPYEKELRRLRKISRVNKDLLINLNEKININLSNYPCLIIKGGAGTGKSHLLGDIANQRLNNDYPAILLLGQLFSVTKTLEENILSLLGFEGSFGELIDVFNGIGKQIGSRIPILIDAINEGPGAKLWKGQIKSLIAQINEKPYVALVLTIRTTYFKSIVDKDLEEDKKITFKEHEGFKGNEYSALKMFCEHHGLKQPSFPILSREYTNPLFLKIMCEGVYSSGGREFPQGFHGINKVFDSFVDAIDSKLEEKREEYIGRKLTREVVNEFSIRIFKDDHRRLELKEAFGLMDEKFPRFPYLLNDLIQEGIFIKNIWHDYKNDNDIEVIYFSYERLGDFYVSKEILNKYIGKEQVLEAFKKESFLGKLLEEDHYKNRGIIEALSILIPEKFGVEIFEAYSWVYEEVEKYNKFKERDRLSNNNFYHYSHISSDISNFFLDSLSWRTIESIDDEKITTWLEEVDYHIDYDEWFLKLVELTVIKNHPLNSDRLFRILNRFSMPERDSFWQQHVRYYSGYQDNGNGFPIKRLLDWAWSTDVSVSSDEEVVRLTGQTLAWILSSTDRKLRDQTTKALVNLLQEQNSALISILKAFEDVDDLYIRERLYAVAYGCVLRTGNLLAVKEISQYVYKTIFKKTIPEHILLRDYARNIIEYAVYKNVPVDFELKLVRPPYKSKIPKLPTDDEISKFNIDHKSSDYDKEYGQTYNSVHFQVMNWDFGEKTIKPEINHFNKISFRAKKKYKKFLKSLNKEQKRSIKLLKIQVKAEFFFKDKKDRIIKGLGSEENYEEKLRDIMKLSTHVDKSIEEVFSGKKLKYVREVIVPFLRLKNEIKEQKYLDNKLNSIPFRRWIVKRVFDLGYDMKLHGKYDKNFSYYGRDSSDKESIGEKYQWIALHEILAIISDNYKIEDFHREDFNYYKGAWQLYARDIDPISITKVNDNEYDDDPFEDEKEKHWWSDENYSYWNQSNFEWSRNIQDLPKMQNVVEKIDDKGNEWLFLEYYPEWQEPKKIGEKKYDSKRKRVHYLIQGYLVNKDEKINVIEFLKNKNFFDRWMPENGDGYTNLFSREKFWSPAYFDSYRDDEWSEVYCRETGENMEEKLIVATTNVKGSISSDKSGANFKYNIPCRRIFEGMNLQYSNIDGDFINDKEINVVTNINKRGTLINKKEFLSFLKENNMEIIWTLLGEKIAQSEGGFYHFGVPCGVFYLDENNLVKGEMNMFERS